jgi:hypothetical protein
MTDVVAPSAAQSVTVDVTRPPSVTVDVTPATTAAVAIVTGPPGPQGPPGPAGAIFSFHQATPAATWTILHSLASKPSVVVLLDSDPTVPVVTDVVYPDLATVVLEFLSPESGYAYL